MKIRHSILLAIMLCSLGGCRTTTTLMTEPPGAKVIDKNGKVLGETPFEYSTKAFVPARRSFDLEKEGYEPSKVEIERNEVHGGRVAGSVILGTIGLAELGVGSWLVAAGSIGTNSRNRGVAGLAGLLVVLPGAALMASGLGMVAGGVVLGVGGGASYPEQSSTTLVAEPEAPPPPPPPPEVEPVNIPEEGDSREIDAGP